MRIANIIAAIVGMLFSGAAFIKTLTFKQFKNVPVGPEFFPRALAVALFICCLILLITSIFSKDKSEAPTLSLKNKDMQKALIGLGIIVVYALLWNVLGFIIATPLAIFAMTFLLGKRNYKMMIIVSIAATAVIFCAFKFILGIEMPMGILEDVIYAIENLISGDVDELDEDLEELEALMSESVSFITNMSGAA